jgi:hypothetical protein
MVRVSFAEVTAAKLAKVTFTISSNGISKGVRP